MAGARARADARLARRRRRAIKRMQNKNRPGGAPCRRMLVSDGRCCAPWAHRDADRRSRRGLCPGPRSQSVSSGQGIGGWRRPGGAGARMGEASGRARDGTAGRGSCRRRRREHLGLHPLRRDEPAAGRARRPVRPRLHVSRRQAQAARHDLQVRSERQRREKLRRPDVHLAARAPCRPRGQYLGDRCGLR